MSPFPSSSRSHSHPQEPFTLLHNLRTRPLTFVAACLGLMGVLAVKVLFNRMWPSSPKSDKR